MEKLTIREKAEVLRQLGHPVRLAILEELMKGGKCVTDIRDLLDVPQPNVSQHLTVLRQQRIVDFTEDGKLRCYFLRRPSFVRALFDFISGSYPEVLKEEKDEPVACCSN
jgi:ArsR family transcriptional regulator